MVQLVLAAGRLVEPGAALIRSSGTTVRVAAATRTVACVNAPSAVVVAHLVATLFMVGLIWFVQVVHYPLMADVGHDHFVRYEQRHRNLTAAVVGLPMAVEGVCTVWLFVSPPHGMGRLVPFIGGILLAVVLASTVWVQVPMHEQLSRGFDERSARRLVSTNWIRTAGWTARGTLAVAMMAVSV